MKSAILTLLYCIIAAAVSGQDGLRAYPIVQDSARVIIDKSYWQLLEDDQQSFTIDQVSRPPVSQQFHPDNSLQAGTHYRVRCWWFRTLLKNTLDREVNLFVTGGMDITEYYLSVNERQWKKMMTGGYVPWSSRNGYKQIDFIPVNIRPGDSLFVYKKVFFKHPGMIPAEFDWRLSSPGRIISTMSEGRVYLFGVVNTLMFGICVFVFFLNLLFYILVKEKQYLYFSLFILCEGFHAAYYPLSEIVFAEYPFAGWIVYHVCVLTFSVCLILFFRQFLGTANKYLKWDRFLSWWTIVMVSVYVAAETLIFFWRDPFTHWLIEIDDTVFFLTFVFVLITLLLYLRNKDKKIRVMLAGAIPTFLYWSSLAFLVYVNESIYTFSEALADWNYEWGFQADALAMTWLIFFFAWMLLIRYMDLRKEILEKTLEKETLEKEKQMERSRMIEQQKEELEKQVTERTADLTRSLAELKSTQQQLIQAEKMASLGELTAGIAHEIQNPLNFVNNFSEINNELIEELKETKDRPGDEISDTLDDISKNNEKIIFHGKRADAIVKGMLQHSRSGTGQKELTDINAMCDEYLRLAFHGLRAKDKSFNASFETDLDPAVGKLNVMPQEMGRVLLNLINNAFYAVNTRIKTEGDDYKPAVVVATKKLPGKIEISVKDNGTGIPEAVAGKIFQPFFTTKPTGEGTGLGLSLAYDIVTKGHGGELRLETKEGEGSRFLIILNETDNI